MALQFNHKLIISGSTWDYSLGNFAEVTLTADRTIDVINTVDMSVGVMNIIQGGSGNYVLTLTGPKSNNWEILLPVDSRTEVTFQNDGGTLYWSMVAQYSPATTTTTTTTAAPTTTTSTTTTTTTTSAGLDSDAQAYITAEETAASIDIDATNENAISALYTDLKAAGVYTDIISMALGYGTGLVNGKSPGTKDLTTINTPTISAAGYTFDGTNDFLNTNVIEAIDFPAKEDETIVMYVKNPTGACMYGGTDGANSTYFFPVGGETSIQQPPDFTISSAGTGLYVITLRNDGIAMTRRVTKNGTQVYLNSPAVTTDKRIATYPMHIGCYNNQGTRGAFAGGIVGICLIFTRGLSNTEMADVNTAVSTFITATSRT